MQKRSYISALTTLIILILTWKYWLIIKPLSFEIIMQSEKPSIITLITELNRKDDPYFKSSFKEQQQITLKNSPQTYTMSFRHKTQPKRLKLYFENLVPNTEYKIQKISFHNGKYPISDLSKFTSTSVTLKQEHSTLVFIPKSTTIMLDYPDRIKASRSIKFDLKIFIIISILSYLLMYKLTSYLADFKINKNISRLDIVFLSLCCAIFFIPMNNINTAEISQKENRTLKKYTPLINNHSINLNYSKDYENWISDRFIFREQLIDIAISTKVIDKYWKTASVIKGQNDWLFYRQDESVHNFQNINLYTTKELENITKYLISINEYCKTHNKKFYFIICPDKNKIYSEYYPPNIKQKKPNEQSKTFQLKAYLNKNTDIKIIYPYEKLQMHKNEILYDNSDTHWNSLGAYYAYEELLKTINKDFNNSISKPKIEITHTNDFSAKTSDLNNMLPNILKVNKQRPYEVTITNKKHICNPQNYINDRYCSTPQKKYNIAVYRDSFATALLPLIAETFHNSQYFWRYNIKTSEITNSDIVILEIVERSLLKLASQPKLED